MDATDNNSAETRDFLFAVGGAALVIIGAGLIMAHPAVRKTLGGVGVPDLLQGAVPDLERYLKLRSM